ncbi:hypothetical protein VF14_33505 [Nostoc linckia z18]|nr:hypothetical protein VF02_35610 [Nostoc linckia z1]PHJ73189.1 hypothetical protein VF06_36180 [Nostoc linckia z4]PHK01818.1 hypothetical protein VF09_32550 [Nostoc linckia z9]PHK10375.1 hypothetical protein VF10_35595 [Nostoc linckia z13]PHK14410.1 hypothetical protein VF11_30920 [Nostoc linckia z14]PHK28680.1 hypothetical protein VF14_33505 [Nostoc linckia z18]PHK31615.1 hypothetical protein VF12_27825 [Nostoc linckia z15]PHK40470.1 hypothetical protein VF13_32880 [Nostoc linckia z16]
MRSPTYKKSKFPSFNNISNFYCYAKLISPQNLQPPEEALEQQTQRADRLAAKLRELNIDPENL